MKSPQLRLTLLGLALGVLLALLIAPQTRWFVRLQTLTALRLYHPLLGSDAAFYTGSEADDERHIQAATAKHPDDFALQYAQAVNTNAGGSARAARNLRALEPRFPDRPTLYANILRYASAGLHMNRSEEDALNGLPRGPQAGHVIPNSLEAVAAFDQDAAAGERLDPSNAYFPIMRAIGLFMAHRDADGLAAVARAGRETGWREYVPDDVEARQRLHEIAFSDPGALPRSAMAYDTVLPHYTLLRSLARLLLYKAVQAERAGRPEEGFQIREHLRHYGDLMRTQSTSLIGSLVGIAIAAISTADPGGVKPPKTEPGLKPIQIAQRRLDAYCAYVTRIGHPEAAVRARNEEDARREVQSLAGPDHLPDMTTPILYLTAWWLTGLTALANILWLLVFGGLAAGAARLVRMEKIERRFDSRWTVNILLTGLALVIIWYVALWQSSSLAEVMDGVRSLTNFGSAMENENAQILTRWLSLAVTVTVPFLLTMILSIAARVRCIPFSVGLVQGFRVTAVPIACALLLVYGGLLLGTVRQERVVNEQVWHSSHDEGPYFAAQAGQTWPGPVN